ncbi:YjcZ family sporulation protein [Priestia endophytica]|uniref:YjcZ family sporulation protein n=1 Tax=Priestia endophytica TaxID=135735 RepID=UPI0022810CC5|nr:YjcZ family sporulation protein [Priestia endophytica]MCY8233757.1 YjcZ family sporulation protein [Priestia endophytica]
MYNNVNEPFPSGENVPFSPAISHGHIAPVYGYGVHHRRCDNFEIIVVLFILLIIIGACTFCDYKG